MLEVLWGNRLIVSLIWKYGSKRISWCWRFID